MLLVLLFPRFSFGWLAWISLIPLLRAVQQAQSQKQALSCGTTAGLIFFGISMFWLTHVTFFGWVFVAFLETAFLMLFTRLVYETRKMKHWFSRLLWTSLAWTVTEWLRAEAPVFGFGWNLLAYSQAGDLLNLQTANFFGAYGLGFLMVWVNGALSQMLRDQRRLLAMNFWPAFLKRRAPFYELRQPFLNALLLMMIVIGIRSHGAYHLNKSEEADHSLRIAVIQGNIPQDIKWDRAARDEIVDTHIKLTQMAKPDRPELVVWPESSFPGYFNRDRLAARILNAARGVGVPFLIGSPHNGNDDEAFNSAYLVDAGGMIAGRYDKQFLVPFGEYVPVKFIFGWLEPLAYSLGVSNFSAGKEARVFQWRKGEMPFSALICFEDTFPLLARTFVQRGAEFLAVLTNDAWFKDSSAPYQHLQASIFRAVENGVPVVRAANTGISGFISYKGEVLARVENQAGKDIFVAGHKTQDILLGHRPTFYQRIGYLFPYLSLMGLAGMYGMHRRKREGK